MRQFDTEWFLQQLNLAGKNQSDLARWLEIDRSAVSRLLKGERKMSAEEQDHLADFLGVTIQEIAAHRRGMGRGFEDKKQTRSIGKALEGTKPKLVSTGDGAFDDPIFGCMKGTMTLLPDLDLTAPADPDWGKVYTDE
ncbi:helix-turn-helix transcriptional regulator [Rhizobium sp. Root1203]|uniref:helix-turn-helix transcriptional regulator n=1 Tax=Rhizobium sp. Root1203 TaxID=1736427 RepID=UPI0009EAB00E|nr:helix-turn-helix transcriptional regulator [Rhizobium sp. Root1203]